MAKRMERKKRFHLQQTQRNLLKLDVKSMATDQNPKKTVCLTCSQMVYLCNTRNSGSLPTLMNQSCLLSHCEPADEWGSAHQRELYHIYHRSDWIEAGGKTIKITVCLFLSYPSLASARKLLRITPNVFQSMYICVYIHTHTITGKLCQIHSLQRSGNKLIQFKSDRSQNYHCDNQGIALRSQPGKPTLALNKVSCSVFQWLCCATDCPIYSTWFVAFWKALKDCSKIHTVF